MNLSTLFITSLRKLSQMHIEKPRAMVHLAKELLHLHQRKSGERAPGGS